MDAILKLLSHPIWGAAGLAIGLIGLAFFWISRRSKQPCWAIRTTQLIRGYSGAFNKLQVHYQDLLVENLAVSRLLFWNQGRETIDVNDVAEADPIRIQGQNGARLLDVQVLTSNHAPSRFAAILDEERGEALIRFDYLDQGHGGVLQVVHTGHSSKDIILLGSIKGTQKIKFRESEQDIPWFIWIVSAVPATILLFTLPYLAGSTNLLVIPWLMVPIVIVAIFLVLLVLGTPMYLYKQLWNRIPRGLHLFGEDIAPLESNNR